MAYNPLRKIFKSSLSVYCRQGYRRLKRFIVWFPIIWKDEDWDCEPLLEIIRFKISRMRLDMKDSYILHKPRYIKEMIIAEELLKRLSYDDFYHDLLESYKDKKCCICPEEKYSFVPLKNGNHQMLFHDCDYCKLRLKIWFKKNEAKKKSDREYLFKHLGRKYAHWWN